MTSYTILHKLPVFLSQWVSIGTYSVLPLVVRSPLNKVLYAEAGTNSFIKIQASVLLGKSLLISSVEAHHPDQRGVIPARGESFSP